MNGNFKARLTKKELLKRAGICFIIFFVCALFSKNESIGPLVEIVAMVSFFSCIGLICYAIIRAIKDSMYGNELPTSIVTSKTQSSASDQELEKHRACFGSKKASSQNTSYDYSNYSDDSDDDDDEYEQRERDFENFRNSLTTIWNSGVFSISFEYSGRKRELLLDKVQINSYDDVYFSGYCFDSNEERTFKTERFDSHVEYAGNSYSPRRFLTEVLGLDLEYVKGLGV